MYIRIWTYMCNNSSARTHRGNVGGRPQPFYFGEKRNVGRVRWHPFVTRETGAKTIFKGSSFNVSKLAQLTTLCYLSCTI